MGDTVRLARAGSVDRFPRALEALPVIPGPVNDPKPGTVGAKGAGCSCPRTDNEDGMGWAYDPNTSEAVFVVDVACRIHGGSAVPSGGTVTR